MTKDEILEKHFPTPEQHPDVPYILNAMGEYARQQAIAFGDWLRTQRADIFYGSPSTEQIYNQFIEQQNKDNA